MASNNIGWQEWRHRPVYLVSDQIDRANCLLLEAKADLADHGLNDHLMKELIMKYVRAERRLHQLNKEKNHFLGMAAHDLRNPLASIIGMSQMLLEMPLDEAIRQEFTTSIKTVSEQMLSMINDLLDVSVIESGHFSLHPVPGRVDHLLEQRLRLAGFLAQAKEMTLTCLEMTPVMICFDADRMAQVVDNLLSNAIKFSPTGSTIEITLTVSQGEAVIMVRDQGPGILEAEQAHLFGHFHRLSNRPTGGERSTGLGLAIVNRIVQAHRGQIRVESRLGQGSAFYVHLPLQGDHAGISGDDSKR